ncbi:MAG: NTP transferase domain-containing protein [Candidatus Bathyarchaeota archaeon]|nr:NTP transferase domain-containing protein [Candidatus Bathyarchaeum sp.]
MANRAAIILSGGRAERFQNAQEIWQDKALVVLHGKPLLVHAVENVNDVVDEVVVCVNNEKRKAHYLEVLKKHNIKNAKLLVDEKRNNMGGPIVGILTGLFAVKADYCFTLPSDMPFFQPNVIDYMFESLKDSRVLVPMWPNGRLETLTMVTKKPDVLEIAKTLYTLKRPRSDDIMRGALNVVLMSIADELMVLDPKLKSFININSQADFVKLQPRQGQGPFVESVRLTFGDLPLPELLRLQKASELLSDDNLLEASKVLFSCSTQLETEGSYFWAAVSRETEGKCLLRLSEQQGCSEFAQQYLVDCKEALLKAVKNYELEAKLYDHYHSIFLAERARSNMNWCKSFVRGKLCKIEGSASR